MSTAGRQNKPFYERNLSKPTNQCQTRENTQLPIGAKLGKTCNCQPVRNAGKHATTNRCQAQENMQPPTSAKRVKTLNFDCRRGKNMSPPIDTKRGKTSGQ